MRVLERYGGRIHFTSGETFSSTKLSHFLLASPEAAQRIRCCETNACSSATCRTSGSSWSS